MRPDDHDRSDPELGTCPPNFTLSSEELVNAVANRDTQWLRQIGGVDALAKALNSDIHSGLSAHEVSTGMNSRIDTYGRNVFKYPPAKSFLALMFEALKDPMIIILCLAAVVSLTISLAVEKKREEFAYLEGLAIIIVIAVVVLVQAVIDKQKDAKFRQLNSVKDCFNVLVRRAGNPTSITTDQLVVGDVIQISAGDKLPADCIFIESSSGLKTNESAMTGEPIDIKKSLQGDPFLYSGTSVSEGVATVLVVAVGEQSQWGVILKSLVVEPGDTPLQERLSSLAWTIGKIGIVIATLTFLVIMARWIADSVREGEWEGIKVLDAFIIAVTIIVVAVPEGLPLAITLSLAFAMRKMMRDNNHVRRLEACETMGSATQLNADKTGTLTQNRMTVVEAHWNDRHVTYDGPMNDNTDENVISDQYRDAVCTSISINTQANLELTSGGLINHLGNKTECALLQHVHKWHRDYTKIRDAHPVARVYMFDSVKKRMSTTERLPSGIVRVHTKGAPELLLNSCDSELCYDGVSVRPLTDDRRNAILKAVGHMASRGLRTLLLAVQDVDHSADDDEFWAEAPDKGYAVIGVVGIKDPIRPETKDAVKQLKEAGVTVRMVTGDNALTATFIAKESGILDNDGIVMEGPVFRALSDSELNDVALKIQVLARSTPTDKLLLVKKLKELGEVTSVTGDGTNDGPALKEADVGFALGIAGTEIAKEACDIVILDDNIQSMTKAVLWGRNVYESIRKFLQFQLVVNVVAVTLNFIAACAGKPLPLGAVPLLWVNMIMDSMGALALATEPPKPDLLKRKPFGRRAPLVNREMWRNIIGISVYQLAVSLVLQFAGKTIFGLNGTTEEAIKEDDLLLRSIIFNVFVFMQVGSEINSRRIAGKNVFQGILSSVWFLIIIVITVAIQIALMFGVGSTKVGRSVGIVSVGGPAWGAALILGALILPWGFLVRLIPLSWCFGPTDEDAADLTKWQRILPKRNSAKPGRGFERDREIEEVFDATGKSLEIEDSTGSGNEFVGVEIMSGDKNSFQNMKMDVEKMYDYESSPNIEARTRLRSFVHAVAFINVMSRTTLSSRGSKSDIGKDL